MLDGEGVPPVLEILHALAREADFFSIGTNDLYNTCLLVLKVMRSVINYEPTIQAIIKGAKTDQIGDGKISVRNLEQCVCIRTGEKGSNAIG